MLTKRQVLFGLALAIPVIGTTLRPAAAASPEIFATGGVAIHGTDPVAYFTENKPVDGSSKHALMWMGATWYFASAANMAAFEADPHRYAPQYGGYCAYAAAQGAVATTVPEAFTIYEGKLYLNFSTGVRGLWQQDIPGNIKAADANWPSVLEK